MAVANSQDDEIQNLSAEEIMQIRLDKLDELDLWEKIASGNLHKISTADVQKLFSIFDTEGCGEISLEELSEIKKVKALTLTAQDVADLCKDADKDGTGMITASQLYKALTEGEVAFNMVKKMLHTEQMKEFKPDECFINDLIDCVNHDYEVNSALWSLPQTVVLFTLFLTCSVAHLAMSESWKMGELHSALLSGYYRFGWIFDYPTLHDWMMTSFIAQHFWQDLSMYPPGRYFARNQIVGGLRLRRTFTDPTKCALPSYLTKTYYPFPILGNLCYQLGEHKFDDKFLLYHEKTDVIKERILNWTHANWLDQNSTAFSIDAIKYNPTFGTITFDQIRWDLENNGFMRQRFIQETFRTSPYENWVSVVPDALFLFLLLKVFYSELKELLPAVRMGLDGFMAYLQFWNVIDWLAIIWGFVCTGLWAIVCIMVADLPNKLSQFPSDALDSIVMSNNSYMTPEEVNIVAPHEDLYAIIGEMSDAAQSVALWHSAVRLACVLYLFILIMKFFKAFKANKRLDVVIQTLVGSLQDVTHFAIVFISIYLCYAWSGHVFFGYNNDGFSTLLKAAYYSWRGGVGMGDMEDLNNLGKFLGYVYTLSYEFLVLNLLLGILFGLIFEAYGRTCKAAGDPPTITQQVRESIKGLSDRRDYIDEWYLVCALDDEDCPAHPADLVNPRSLRQAFNKDNMSKENAEYWVKRASDYAKANHGEVTMSLLDCLKVMANMRTSGLKAIVTTERLIEKLREESRKPQEFRYTAIMSGFDPDDPKDIEELHRTNAIQEFNNARITAELKAGNRPLPAIADGFEEDETEIEPFVEEEELTEEKELLRKVTSVFEGVEILQENGSQLISSIRSELQHYMQESQVQEEQLSEECVDLLTRARDSEQGVSKLAECFEGADLQTIQFLPERISKLTTLAQKSRSAVETGKRGNGADILKRLEQRLSSLSNTIHDLAQQADAEHDLKQQLSKIDDVLKELQ
eukprot:gb/GFBE01025268.1/.p1 GENE.gb/GFBE01025268.1/~~gb/GFBE01025268.1/.p1  ORF type:complete len:974 (+),score=227.42 gb/GFBE01025268.1/:1-2922(+)